MQSKWSAYYNKKPHNKQAKTTINCQSDGFLYLMQQQSAALIEDLQSSKLRWMPSQFLPNTYSPYKPSHRITGSLYKCFASSRYARWQLRDSGGFSFLSKVSVQNQSPSNNTLSNINNL
ncbi:MAG: hypothetical protein ACPHUC_02590 [Psychrobacter celer]